MVGPAQCTFLSETKYHIHSAPVTSEATNIKHTMAYNENVEHNLNLHIFLFCYIKRRIIHYYYYITQTYNIHIHIYMHAQTRAHTLVLKTNRLNLMCIY